MLAPVQTRSLCPGMPPSSDGGKPVSGYDVYEATAAGGSASLAGTTGASVTTYTVTGLEPGTSYEFYVTALNSDGPGDHSNEVSASIKPNVPANPTGLTAIAGVDQVNLSWAAPSSDGGAPIKGYEIHEGMAPGDPGAVVGTSLAARDHLHGQRPRPRDQLLLLRDSPECGRFEPTFQRGGR